MPREDFMRATVLIFALSFLVRLAIEVGSGSIHRPLYGDEKEYWGIAGQLLEGNGFSRNGVDPTAQRLPGYPAFLAGSSLVLDSSIVAHRTLGIVVSAAAYWLRNAEDRLERSDRALTAIPQGVFMVDRLEAGRPNLYVNSAYTTLTGHSVEEAVSSSFEAVAIFADPEVPRSLAASLGEGGGSHQVVLRRRNGTVFPAKLAVSAVPRPDGERYVIGLIEDVTAEELAAKQRLELLAVVRGLEALAQPSRVTLVTPSRYVNRGLAYGLAEWRANGWQWEHFGQMVPVKNRDLWQRVDRALAIHEVECFAWNAEEPEACAEVAAVAGHLSGQPVGGEEDADLPGSKTHQQTYPQRRQNVAAAEKISLWGQEMLDSLTGLRRTALSRTA